MNNSETFIICHFLSALRHSNTISEQLSATNNLTPCSGYSKNAGKAYFYGVDKDGVDTIKWADGKIKIINKI